MEKSIIENEREERRRKENQRCLSLTKEMGRFTVLYALRVIKIIIVFN